MSVILINSFAFGGAGLDPQRYWRLTFTVTNANNYDLWVEAIHGFDSKARGRNVLAGAATITSNMSPHYSKIEALNTQWPWVMYSSGHFDDSINVANNYQIVWDMGAGNEVNLQFIDVYSGGVGSECGRDFTIEYSENGSDWFTSWSTGAVSSYGNYASQSFSASPAIETADTPAGILAEHSKTFVISGKAAAGQTVQHSKTFVISGKRDDGPTVTEATTYVVVTP